MAILFFDKHWFVYNFKDIYVHDQVSRYLPQSVEQLEVNGYSVLYK